MTDLYQPASDFLVMVINGEVPLTGSVFAEANLSRLIDYTRDSDLSNRDWATFHLGHTDIDTPEVRTALHDRLNDEDPTIQEEAMLGLARRRDETALPLMRDWLQARPVSQIILEAAEAFADNSLCVLLSKLSLSEDDDFLRFLWKEACCSCGCEFSL